MRWYPAGLEAVGGSLDLTADPLVLYPLKEGYAYSGQHRKLSDISAGDRFPSGPLLGTRSMIGGSLVTDTAKSPVTVAVDVLKLSGWLLATGGSPEGDRVPLCWWDVTRDGAPIWITTDGEDVEVEFFSLVPGGTDYAIARI